MAVAKKKTTTKKKVVKKASSGIASYVRKVQKAPAVKRVTDAIKLIEKKLFTTRRGVLHRILKMT
jgi:hypothetical protein